MNCFTNPASTPSYAQIKTTLPSHHHLQACSSLSKIQATFNDKQNFTISRRKMVTTTLLANSVAAVLGLNATPMAFAENWGTRSFLLERFFQPDLSPEDSAARIRQTAEGLHSIRDMLETMSWRYVLFYIRQKAAYLNKDMKNAISVVPLSKQDSYVKTANELVNNMSEFDSYIRTPKVYESYLYYEKTLKSIDDLVALLA